MKNVWKLSVIALLLVSLVACGAQTGQDTPSDGTPASTISTTTQVEPTMPVPEEPAEDTTTTTTTTTTAATTTTTTAAACAHNFSKATCEKPATCSLCGETQGEKSAHSYNKGTCSVCGTSDPSFAKIAKALKAIERYPKYIAINKDLLDTQYDLFRLNGEMKHFNDAHETTLEIHDYLQKMIEKCEDYVDDDLMLAKMVEDCQECNLEMPIVPGSTSTSALRSYISDCKSYARKADRISVLYKTICRSYGVEVE